MCCSITISKMILFVMNAIFFLLGGGALALGVFLIVDKSYLLGILGNIPTADNFDVEQVINSTSFLENGAYILIGAGSVIFFIAFCGLCGGIRESKCLLYIYSVVLSLILLLEISAGALCYFYGNYVETYLQEWLTTLVASKYTGATLGASNTVSLSSDSTGISDAIDFAQVSLQCCGVTNYTDFASASNWAAEYNFTSGGSTYTLSNVVVPVSCCKLDNPSSWPSAMSSITFVDLETCLTSGTANSTNIDSCYSTVKDLLVQYSMIAIGVGIGVGCLEVFGLLAACCIIHKKKDSDRKKVAPA